MYPKKTLSAASLLSECERKRRRSLEARGERERVFVGIAVACPFSMSEQYNGPLVKTTKKISKRVLIQ